MQKTLLFFIVSGVSMNTVLSSSIGARIQQKFSLNDRAQTMQDFSTRQQVLHWDRINHGDEVKHLEQFIINYGAHHKANQNKARLFSAISCCCLAALCYGCSTHVPPAAAPTIPCLTSSLLDCTELRCFISDNNINIQWIGRSCYDWWSGWQDTLIELDAQLIKHQLKFK